MTIEGTEIFRTDGPEGRIGVELNGDPAGEVVLMSHAILTSAQMWDRQAQTLADAGYRVVRMDTRGHGASDAPPPPYSMADLVGDTIAVLDALEIKRAHFVGLSLGGMIGFGLGIHHGKRIASLFLCDARADAPGEFVSQWDERIAIAFAQGTVALAESTTERWFGKTFCDKNPEIVHRFHTLVAATSVDGFVGCSRAIMGLDYIGQLGAIAAPTTLIVGEDDGPLPQAMRDLQHRIAGSRFEEISAAGHLPNISQPERFDALLLEHLKRAASAPD